jgi:single-strand DNA-binding protein
VQGRLKQRSYETKEGEKRTSFELDVDEIGPSLRYATAQVTRAASSREGGGGGGSFGGGRGGGQQGQVGGGQQSEPWGQSAPAQGGGQQGGGSQGGDVWNTPGGGGTYNDETPF